MSTCLTPTVRNRVIAGIALVVASILSTKNSAASVGTVTLSDQTFSNSDWSASVMTPGTGGSAVVGQQFASGNPYRAYTHTVNNPTPTLFGDVSVFHFRNSAIFTPSVYGAIDSLSYSEDTFTDGRTIGCGLALLQNGIMYAGGYRFDSGAWATHSRTSLHATDFDSWYDNASGVPVPPITHPDFSASAPAITFGFYRANSQDAGLPAGYTVIGGTDNWSVTVNYVPEPSSMLVAVIGAGMVLCQRRRATGALRCHGSDAALACDHF